MSRNGIDSQFHIKNCWSCGMSGNCAMSENCGKNGNYGTNGYRAVRGWHCPL